ncbi:hypothetical protein SAMN02745219_02858 [Desulfofundulus thermosubterraneus DSM 16057]|uniref:Uncharacterized protein n=1 Tax=Desulfofundulus thermosubterraneus DSM 16057 TaxID=1121432 RepID=A0A1M6KF02_9FIRM|nr:hypothetical protein SAMN02745219_02858 [Desulfofundulus thermosubterraneus DSM 16057]
MDITWLFLFLCPYMLLYFYLWDFTTWNHRKIVIFWVAGLFILIGIYSLINFLNPIHPAFPGLF